MKKIKEVKMITQEHRLALVQNRTALADNLDMRKIISDLFQESIIDVREQQDLQLDRIPNYERVEKFLDMMGRKPDWAYIKFKEILEVHNCRHLAQLLHKTDSSAKVRMILSRSWTSKKEDIEESARFVASFNKIVDEKMKDIGPLDHNLLENQIEEDELSEALSAIDAGGVRMGAINYNYENEQLLWSCESKSSQNQFRIRVKEFINNGRIAASFNLILNRLEGFPDLEAVEINLEPLPFPAGQLTLMDDLRSLPVVFQILIGGGFMVIIKEIVTYSWMFPILITAVLLVVCAWTGTDPRSLFSGLGISNYFVTSGSQIMLTDENVSAVLVRAQYEANASMQFAGLRYIYSTGNEGLIQQHNLQPVGFAHRAVAGNKKVDGGMVAMQPIEIGRQPTAFYLSKAGAMPLKDYQADATIGGNDTSFVSGNATNSACGNGIEKPSTKAASSTETLNSVSGFGIDEASNKCKTGVSDECGVEPRNIAEERLLLSGGSEPLSLHSPRLEVTAADALLDPSVPLINSEKYEERAMTFSNTEFSKMSSESDNAPSLNKSAPSETASLFSSCECSASSIDNQCSQEKSSQFADEQEACESKIISTELGENHIETSRVLSNEGSFSPRIDIQSSQEPNLEYSIPLASEERDGLEGEIRSSELPKNRNYNEESVEESAARYLVDAVQTGAKLNKDDILHYVKAISEDTTDVKNTLEDVSKHCESISKNTKSLEILAPLFAELLSPNFDEMKIQGAPGDSDSDYQSLSSTIDPEQMSRDIQMQEVDICLTESSTIDTDRRLLAAQNRLLKRLLGGQPETAWRLAEQLRSTDVETEAIREECEKNVVENFKKMSDPEYLLKVSQDLMHRILASDELQICTETETLTILLNWLMVKKKDGTESLFPERLLPLIRWSGIGGDYVKEHLLENQLFGDYPACKEFLRGIKRYVETGMQFNDLKTFQRPYTKLTNKLIILTSSRYEGSRTEICLINLQKSYDVNRPDEYGPSIIDGSGATMVGRKNLYVLGLGDDKNEVWIRNGSGWARTANLLVPRLGHCATSLREKLYIVGGCHPLKRDSPTRDVYELDTNKEIWKRIGNLKYAVCEACCMVYDKFIYVFGGKGKDNKQLNCIQVFSLTKNIIDRWITVPTTFPDLRLAIWNSVALILGPGYSYVFDFKSETFTRNNYKFAPNGKNFTAVVDNGYLFLVEGGNKDDASNQESEVTKVRVTDFLKSSEDQRIRHARLSIISNIHASGIVSVYKDHEDQ